MSHFLPVEVTSKLYNSLDSIIAAAFIFCWSFLRTFVTFHRPLIFYWQFSTTFAIWCLKVRSSYMRRPKAFPTLKFFTWFPHTYITLSLLSRFSLLRIPCVVSIMYTVLDSFTFSLIAFSSWHTLVSPSLFHFSSSANVLAAALLWVSSAYIVVTTSISSSTPFLHLH